MAPGFHPVEEEMETDNNEIVQKSIEDVGTSEKELETKEEEANEEKKSGIRKSPFVVIDDEDDREREQDIEEEEEEINDWDDGDVKSSGDESSSTTTDNEHGYSTNDSDIKHSDDDDENHSTTDSDYYSEESNDSDDDSYTPIDSIKRGERKKGKKKDGRSRCNDFIGSNKNDGFSSFDANYIFSLPALERKEAIENAQREQRIASRGEFLNVAAKPIEYSRKNRNGWRWIFRSIF